MKSIIISREESLKGKSRAKTKHPGEFDPNIWIGGKELDYRFKRNGIVIVKDIYESLGYHLIVKGAASVVSGRNEAIGIVAAADYYIGLF